MSSRGINKSQGKGKQNQLRIIGGNLRGRKLSFPDSEGLRPTGDRIRETLFNWLARHIVNANVADLFAGSGALGFEAASRMAESVYLVEQNKLVSKSLQENIEKLGIKNIQLENTSANNFLAKYQGKPFDLVFLDPPFGKGLITSCCQALVEHKRLNPEALIYIESSRDLAQESVPSEWQLFKEKSTGNVNYRLYRNN